MPNPQEFDPLTAIYTPQQTATYGIEEVKKLHANKSRGLALNIAGMRDYFAPVMPGQVCAIIAQTSNYKTGFMEFWEHSAAEEMTRQGRENEIIIHVSVEDLIEEQAFMEFARESGEDAGDLARGNVQDWDLLMASAVKVGNIPIYRLGSSMARAEDMPNLYLSNMIRAIKYLRDELLDWKPTIAAIFFDYLQAFPIDPEVRQASHEAQRRLQVRSDMFRVRIAAAHFKCPVIVGVQAKQVLAGARPPLMLPGIYDGEETSSIGQRADRILSLWMPKMTDPIGSTIMYNGGSFKVEENMLWVKVVKQRGRLPSGKAWGCRVDFQTNNIAPEANQSLEDGRQ